MKLELDYVTIVTARAALRYWAETTRNEDYKRECEQAYVTMQNALQEAYRKEYMPDLSLPKLLQRQAG